MSNMEWQHDKYQLWANCFLNWNEITNARPLNIRDTFHYSQRGDHADMTHSSKADRRQLNGINPAVAYRYHFIISRHEYISSVTLREPQRHLSSPKGGGQRANHYYTTANCDCNIRRNLYRVILLYFTLERKQYAFFASQIVHGDNMGPTWVLSAPDGPHVDPLAIGDYHVQV